MLTDAANIQWSATKKLFMFLVVIMGKLSTVYLYIVMVLSVCLYCCVL